MVNGAGKQRAQSISEIRNRAFVYYVAMELGIIPIEDVDADIAVVLNRLTSEESRKMRRKFRKLWRRFAREAARKKGVNKKALKTRLGIGQAPSFSQMRARKELVKRSLWQKYILPQVERFETIGGKIQD